MVLSHVEGYEALKGPVGEEAARMIAEIVHPASDLATKQDIAELRAGIEARFAEQNATFEARFAEQNATFEARFAEQSGGFAREFARVQSEITGRLWVMFVPLWLGLYGLIATLLVQGW